MLFYELRWYSIISYPGYQSYNNPESQGNGGSNKFRFISILCQEVLSFFKAVIVQISKGFLTVSPLSELTRDK